MSLLKNTTPPELPKLVRLSNTTNRIRNMSKNCFENLVKVQRDGIDILWNHPNLTPQEIIDGLGADVLKVFHFHAKLSDFIEEMAEFDNIEVDLKKPTKAFTIDHNTGKVTVLDQPYNG